MGQPFLEPRMGCHTFALCSCPRSSERDHFLHPEEQFFIRVVTNCSYHIKHPERVFFMYCSYLISNRIRVHAHLPLTLRGFFICVKKNKSRWEASEEYASVKD